MRTQVSKLFTILVEEFPLINVFRQISTNWFAERDTKTKMDLKEVKKIVKALIVTEKGGMPMDKLEGKLFQSNIIRHLF